MGASAQYGFWFTLNSLLGYSILDNPMEVIGLIILLITLILVFLLSRRLYKMYKTTEDKPTLYFFLSLFFFFLAAIFLVMEKFSYSTLGSVALGDLGGVIALNFSGAAILCMVLFAFSNTFPEHIKILGIIVAVFTFIHIEILCWAILTGPPVKDIINYEIIYLQLWIDLLTYFIAVPITLVPPISFYYFTIKTRGESRATSNRSFWFGTGILSFDIGYIAELAPFFPSDLSIILRSLFIVAIVILHICFVKEWTD